MKLRIKILIALLLFHGCAIVPHPVDSGAADISPETGLADSGIGTPILIDSGPAFPVQPSFVVKYGALVDKYQSRFTPPVDKASGFRTINGVLYCDGYVITNLAKMAEWERAAGKTQ